VYRRDEESWVAFARRVRETPGESIVVLTAGDSAFLQHEDERAEFLADLAKVRYRVKFATRDAELLAAARAEGIEVFRTTRELRRVLQGHPDLGQALRLFSPQVWRQQWRSHLQRIGLLSLPKFRIWVLGGLSVILFLFVILRLLPSADIRVWPKQETIDYTSNIVLALSGATLAPTHVRTLPLIPFTVQLRSSLLFKDISREFIGTSASVKMTLINHSTEEYKLKKGTRMVNQAGMIFKLDRTVSIPAQGTGSVLAKAADQDLYGEDIGARGNVPAGLKWDFLGLNPEERLLVYAENRSPGTGGTSASRRVLQSKDLQVAQELLKKQLSVRAKEIVQEKRALYMQQHPGSQVELLEKDDVIKKAFTGVVLPLALLGKPVDSAPVEGTLVYTVYGYDSHAVLDMLRTDSAEHVSDGMRVLPESFIPERMRVYIIDYDDNLSWIKITADLLGLQEFVLDPLTPVGARFAKHVRETAAGLSKSDASRVIRNMQEVDKVSISLWPPWSGSLPEIPSHISLETQ
jgi:hypothetical protein